ncbi:hypothetical protein ACFS6H_05355 [Terrimonas rubra]|uniref:Uncharacterized protein n=1 Tax=Terrimonas rubra TaxID=1035890 RepID=A0ABW6A4I0_9BACT
MKFLIITAFLIASNVLSANSHAVSLPAANIRLSAAVTIKDFTAQVTGNKTKLHWSVLNNSNASSIEVEYSADGKTFTQAGLVWCSEESATENYGLTINNKSNYYRLKLTCKDGTVLYANTNAGK